MTTTLRQLGKGETTYSGHDGDERQRVCVDCDDDATWVDEANGRPTSWDYFCDKCKALGDEREAAELRAQVRTRGEYPAFAAVAP